MRTLTLQEKPQGPQLIGESPVFLAQVNKIPVLARGDASVLVLGETGTGKEVWARAVHACGPRAGKSFIPLSCGAVPTELVDNELFGHVRGAFTDACTAQCGFIQRAEGGTLFLDGIDHLPPAAQVKLVRFLQARRYRPLGAMKARRADVRIIAATNRDLAEAVTTGQFCPELYERLNTVSIMLPPLRERHEDIPLLAEHFLAKYTAVFQKPMRNLSAEALQLLMGYKWPGNIRELENVIARAVVFSEQMVLHTSDILLPHKIVAARPDPF